MLSLGKIIFALMILFPLSVKSVESLEITGGNIVLDVSGGGGTNLGFNSGTPMFSWLNSEVTPVPGDFNYYYRKNWGDYPSGSADVWGYIYLESANLHAVAYGTTYVSGNPGFSGLDVMNATAGFGIRFGLANQGHIDVNSLRMRQGDGIDYFGMSSQVAYHYDAGLYYFPDPNSSFFINSSRILLNSLSDNQTLSVDLNPGVYEFYVSMTTILSDLYFHTENFRPWGRFELDMNVTESSQSTAVPEPATLLLFGAGLAGLGLMRKRFKV